MYLETISEVSNVTYNYNCEIQVNLYYNIEQLICIVAGFFHYIYIYIYAYCTQKSV